MPTPKQTEVRFHGVEGHADQMQAVQTLGEICIKAPTLLHSPIAEADIYPVGAFVVLSCGCQKALPFPDPIPPLRFGGEAFARLRVPAHVPDVGGKIDEAREVPR